MNRPQGVRNGAKLCFLFAPEPNHTAIAADSHSQYSFICLGTLFPSVCPYTKCVHDGFRRYICTHKTALQQTARLNVEKRDDDGSIAPQSTKNAPSAAAAAASTHRNREEHHSLNVRAFGAWAQVKPLSVYYSFNRFARKIEGVAGGGLEYANLVPNYVPPAGIVVPQHFDGGAPLRRASSQ